MPVGFAVGLVGSGFGFLRFCDFAVLLFVIVGAGIFVVLV